MNMEKLFSWIKVFVTDQRRGEAIRDRLSNRHFSQQVQTGRAREQVHVSPSLGLGLHYKKTAVFKIKANVGRTRTANNIFNLKFTISTIVKHIASVSSSLYFYPSKFADIIHRRLDFKASVGSLPSDAAAPAQSGLFVAGRTRSGVVAGAFRYENFRLCITNYALKRR
ncbi:hypothetical protein F2Q69_00053529 [Brassica cretica]|uniref:Uncharacterized protein n=1 Tax=Brassica cretica TaxID=69181 RepID=A0A8S9NCM1_BRACR|nr:hypothetical protein F2Q69_00053529 [Brassica cretica]